MVETKFTEKVLVISHTSSRKCKEHELSEIRDENDKKRPLLVKYHERTRIMKFYYVVYKILRTIYVSIYFYFLPIFAMVITSYIPVITRGSNWKCPTTTN